MTSKGEDFFDSQYYHYNRRFLTVIGLWPYQVSSIRLPCVYLIMLIMISAVLGQIYTLIKLGKNIKQISDLLQTFLPVLCFTSCYCDIAYNFSIVKESFDRVKIDWNNLTNEDELITMKKSANLNNLLCITVACTVYIYSTLYLFPFTLNFVLYISGAINDTQIILPVYNEIFVANKLMYILTFICEMLGSLVLSTIGIAYLTLLIAYAQHVCGLFDIAILKLSQPFKADACFDRSSCDIKQKAEFEWITAVIKFYADIINFVEMIKILYGGTYVLRIFVTFLIIVLDFFYIFQILDWTISMDEAIRNSVFIVGNLLTIYFIFYLGQRLIDNSMDLRKTCCQIPFYMLSNRTNKLLLLLLTRSMKPCEFSLRGTFVASHELFAKITKMSFSFATIFYNTQ